MQEWIGRAERQELSFAHTLPPRELTPKCAVMHTNGGGPNVGPYWEDEYKQSGNRICAHFNILHDGTIVQFVPLSKVAFAAYSANPFAIHIETEDDGHPSQEWTSLQVGAISWLLDELGIPPRICPTDHSGGVGYHEQFPDWNRSHHACPGKVREDQLRNVIVPGLRGTPHVGEAYNVPPWYHRVLAVKDPLMSGRDVMHVQEIVGIPQDAVDSIYGPHTANHVSEWQTHHGLDPDGKVGPRTAHKMYLVNHPDLNR